MTEPKLRFKEFDEDWELTKLENKIDFLAGYAFDSKMMSNDVESYQLIKMSNVYQNKLDITRNPSYWKTLDKKIEKFLLSKGDIVLTLTGTVGKTDYGYNVEITEENRFLLNQRLVRLRGKLDKSNSKFIQHRISTDRFFYHFFNSSKGGTGNQSNVSIEDLKLLELPFPSLQEQTKIAAFLSTVDEKISQLMQKHQLLSQYKQGMMQKLFSQQIRFKADDGSEFGEWDFIELGTATDVTKLAGYEFTKHIVYKDSGNLIALRGLNVKNNKLDLSDVKYIDDSDLKMLGRSKLYIDDLIFTYVGTIGDVALIQENEKFYLAPNVARIRANKELLNPVYLLQYFNETSFRRNEIEKYIATSSQPALSMTNIRKFHIAKPCLDEQTKIANLLSAIDQKVEVVAQQIEQAKIWKKGLLQQMFV